MPSNPWHPKLPTSAKARRMLRKCGSCIELYDGLLSMVVSENGKPESRYIIGTVAARLCHELSIAAWRKHLSDQSERQQKESVRWGDIASQWEDWADGKDWQ